MRRNPTASSMKPSPGDLGLAEEKFALTNHIERLAAQESIVVYIYTKSQAYQQRR